MTQSPRTSHSAATQTANHAGGSAKPQDADALVTTLRYIGPAMAQSLARADIHLADDLRQIGADEAYTRMMAAGTRPHFIGYYALVMALQGRPWRDCKGAEKAALRQRFDALPRGAAVAPDGLPDALSRFLNQIGVTAAD